MIVCSFDNYLESYDSNNPEYRHGPTVDVVCEEGLLGRADGRIGLVGEVGLRKLLWEDADAGL